MKNILCYGDSNTWGCVPITCAPVTMERYEWNIRWPGVLQGILGNEYHVTENALNGRTTVFEDPIEEGRCGKAGFSVVLEAAAPLDLVIIMLGTNDCKDRFNKRASDIALGMDLLVQYVKRGSYGNPQILIASPIHLGSGWDPSWSGLVFSDRSTQISKELAPLYEWVAKNHGCHYMDAAPYAQAVGDSIHTSPEGHESLGKAFAQKVLEILK